MSKLKPIRDPVHDYISTTSIEISIIDSQEFQRLRFVLQNASAYLTYPSSTNNRFLHSLGVMHLSGLFFVNALRNSDSKTLTNYLFAADEILKKYEDESQFDTNDYIQQWQESLGNISQFSHDPFCKNRIEFIYENGDGQSQYYLKNSFESKDELIHDPYYIINTLWQSLRLAALIHDIGHLPMSHIFEEAITDCQKYGSNELRDTLTSEISKRKEAYMERISHDPKRKLEFNEILQAGSLPIHELRGLTIFEKYRSKLKDKSAVYTALVYRVAKDIFLLQTGKSKEEEDYFKSLRCLHEVISGELDADRLDYCLRDPKSSGLEFGAIDVRRILDNIVLYEVNGRFFILPTDKSLSAIESFFHQRYSIYQYFIYHHNVVRSDGVLKEIIARLIEQAYNSTSDDLRDLLNRFNFVKKPGDSDLIDIRLLPDKYSHIFDDAWLRTLFSEVFALLNNNSSIRKKKWAKHLNLLIDTFLYRKTNNLFSMWKRPTDFQKTYQKIADILGEDVSSLVNKKPLTLQKVQSSKRELLAKTLKNIREKIESQHNVLTIHRYLEPKIFRFESSSEHLKILISDQETSGWKDVYIGNASPYIKSLIETTLGTPNYHISFVGESIKDKPEIVESCINIVVGNLADYCKKIKELDVKEKDDLSH